jgi:WD40 repeat protein
MKTELFAALTGHRDAVYALASGTENHLFYSAGGDGMIVEWDLQKPEEGRLVARMPATVYSLAYDKATHILFAGLRNGHIYKLDTGNASNAATAFLHSEVFSLQPAGDMIIAGTGKGKLFLLDDALRVMKEIAAAEKSCRAIAAHPQKNEIASGWSDRQVRIFDRELNLLKSFPAHENSVFAAAYSTGGKRLFTGGRDAKLNEWNAEEDYTLMQSLPAHWYTINHLITGDDLLFSASRDKTIRIWQQNPLKLLHTVSRPVPEAHSHSVNRLLWTGFENLLVSAGDDKVVRVWRVER